MEGREGMIKMKIRREVETTIIIGEVGARAWNRLHAKIANC